PNYQLRKGAWLPRSFTLSTLNFFNRQSGSDPLLFVVVGRVGELLSARVRPGERNDARLPVFSPSGRGRHHHFAVLRSRGVVGALVHGVISQRVEGRTSFDWVRFAIKLSRPGPMDWLPILINSIGCALDHVAFRRSVSDRGILV